MKKEQIFSLASYAVVGLLAVGFAFAISMKFLSRSFSQEPPTLPAAEAVQQVVAQAESGDLDDLQGFLEPFLYDGTGRRDPFQPYSEYRPEESGRPIQPTQRYETEEFQLLGIMWDIRDPKAMFLDPEQKVHVVGRDESIGRKNGYVAAIREGEVVVVESQRKQGDIVYKTKVMKLNR